MKKETNSQKPSFEDLSSLAGFTIEFFAKNLNAKQVEYWKNNKTSFGKKLREVFCIVDEYSKNREEWRKFYKTKFDWDVDFSFVIIPVMPNVGKWRLLFVARGLTCNLALKKASLLFKTWKGRDDLDKDLKNIRNTDSHYAVWVRDKVEPDIETLGKSTNEADPDMKKGITLLERIVFEIKYFAETGNHLDFKGVTFCSGSRYAGGDVPRAFWGGGGLNIGSRNPDDSVSGCGVRSAG